MIALSDKRDLAILVANFTGLIAILSVASIGAMWLLGITWDQARPLVSCAAIAFALTWILRSELSHLWPALLVFACAAGLAGSYDVMAELYVEQFTILGFGHLPQTFNHFYAAAVGVLALLGIWLLTRKS